MTQSSGAESQSGGGTSWSGTGNVRAEDNVYCTINAKNQTAWLLCSNFGFDLPANTVSVDGIVVGLNGTDSVPLVTIGTNGEQHIQLLNTSGSPDYADNGATPGGHLIGWGPDGSGSYRTYGTSSYKWGRSSWAVSDIEDSDFGVGFRLNYDSADNLLKVDHVRITVYYTTSPDEGPKSLVREARVLKSG